MMAHSSKSIKNIFLILIGILIINILSSYLYIRFDLTQDQRFTLSEVSIHTLKDIKSPMFIEVFLNGEFPSEFKRLQSETKQLLQEFATQNSNIKFKFVDPLVTERDAEALFNFGAKPVQIEVKENGKLSTQQVFPWAIATYEGSPIKIPLLKNQLGITSEDRVNRSIQNLEYAFTDAFTKLVYPKQKKVAVIKGNGELEDKYVVDFFTTLREYYYIAPFTLDSVKLAPMSTLEQLKKFDLIVIARPTEAFTEEEKYILDQYTMNGGNSLWLIDAVELKNDSISGNNFAFGKELNLTDFFFKYGIRVNPNLVKDIYSAPILLASGSERESQYNRYPWFYSPLSSSNLNHPIVTNIEAVKFDYASSIDTLPNKLNKTILLSTSPIAKEVGMPIEIDITNEINKNLQIINEGPPSNDYNTEGIPLAVLLEGPFLSAYQNRIKPLNISDNKDEGISSKMVIISDGSIIKNQFQDQRPLELGYDKWTNAFYGNKEFLLNTVNYLLDDNGLINIRSKVITVPFLDPEKTTRQRSLWQLINLLLPLLLLTIFGVVITYLRKRKYT